MKVSRYDGSDARRILAAMVMDQTVCSRISAKWIPEGLFGSTAENLVAGWCVRYMRKYSKPPRKAIQSIFMDWAEKRNGDDEKTTRGVERFLAFLSDDYSKEGPLSSEYVLDLAGEHFDRVRMRKTIDSVETELNLGEINKARERINSSQRIDLGVGSVFKPGDDLETWIDALSQDQERPLVTYPKRMGEFFDRDLSRDCFVSFIGATGIGKSWWLLDLAYRAARQGRRVALFEVGDMSERQVVRRLGQRALRRPRVAGEVAYPIGWDDEQEPVIDERSLNAITPRDCLKYWKKVQRERDLLRLSVHPSNSVNILGIDSVLKDWAREEWVVDVIVLDYADLLAPPPGVKEGRDRINETWKHMRRISQEFHCLFVTATQADARSYDRELINRSNFSDDRRKNDHVTGMIGLNTTVDEKEIGLTRLNWLKRRDAAFLESRQLRVAGCLSVGAPALTAIWSSNS
jgi:hypothetical protein